MSAFGSTNLARLEAQPPALADRGQEQHAFHPGKRLADAAPCARPEREIGEARAGRLGLGGEALRVETEGVRPEARVAMDDVGREGEDGACGS